MLDIRWIRENPQEMAAGLAKRGISPDEAKRQVDGLIARDEARRAHVASLQEMQERRNYLSKEIGAAMRDKDMARAEELKAEVARIKAVIQEGEGKERGFDDELRDALAGIPNLPLPDVPVGRDERDNVELRVVGEKPRMNFPPKEHYELGEALGMMDFETAARLSGARFTVLKGKLARLERALGQFMLDLHTNEHGYTEVQPPLLVRDETMFGTGQLPKFGEDLFRTTDGRWL
ncbi:MAG: serine--tRNA ligase, partial [Rhizobiaceae bacterium]